MRTFVQLREILYIKCVLYSYYLLCREYDHCSSTDPRHEAVTQNRPFFTKPGETTRRNKKIFTKKTKLITPKWWFHCPLGPFHLLKVIPKWFKITQYYRWKPQGPFWYHFKMIVNELTAWNPIFHARYCIFPSLRYVFSSLLMPVKSPSNLLFWHGDT